MSHPLWSRLRMNSQDVQKLFDLTGRTVLITGGTGVLGAAMAEGVVAAGANVALLARNPAKAQTTLARLAGGPGQAMAVGERKFFDLTEEALRSVLDTNLMGTFLPSQVFARGMAERGEGVILNISSMTAYKSLTRVVAYSASKAGVSNFTHWLA